MSLILFFISNLNSNKPLNPTHQLPSQLIIKFSEYLAYFNQRPLLGNLSFSYYKLVISFFQYFDPFSNFN